jgi:hypothetical protein
VLKRSFVFRPWVRRAGLSIVIVAAVVTLVISVTLSVDSEARYGWMGERPVWVYLAALWAGGLRVWLGTMRPVGEMDDEQLVLRPLHQFTTRVIRWDTVRGTEQAIGGDRMIVYFDTARGMRFVAMNLNLVKGRRDFVTLVEEKLSSLGFVERIRDRSRYLSKL